jgi:hypothetical protein
MHEKKPLDFCSVNVEAVQMDTFSLSFLTVVND